MRRVVVVVAVAGVLVAGAASGCVRSRADANDAADRDRERGAITIAPPITPAEPSQRPGMVFVPPGTFRAGTPPDKTPRVADEEMPGDAVSMQGFYIDVYPYPDEPGAIPTTAVTRDEAEQICEQKQKRLCTELEWERACKGAGSTTFEYGDAYRKETCGTGIAPEEAARRPNGERAMCKSSFGVSDMHGGVWEWTSSPWGRGQKDRDLGVLRGGNAVAGELVGRCANALGRAPTKKAPTMGFRCCAGPKNASEVRLAFEGTPGFSGRAADELKATWGDALAAIGPAGTTIRRAWKWVPVQNDELMVFVSCEKSRVETASCAVSIGRDGRALDDKPEILTFAEVGWREPLADVVRLGDTRHLRLRGLDARGTFGRDITYVYGRVELSQPNRP